MTVRIEEFVAHLGWEVDPGKLKEFDKQVNKISATFKKVAIAIGAATAAVTALIVHTNRETAEMANLAKSVGLTTDNLLALSGVVSEIGLNTENVIDLVEEMNNKMGEKKGLGQFSAVEESLRLLNLDFKELEQLAPDKQFIRILDAAAKLGDQQKAVSAVDMLFGGEANKILGFIREMGTSLDEIIEKQKALNFLSEGGIERATKFNSAWGDVKTIISSVWAEFAGFAGSTLTPMLEDFREWVIQNRELIKIKIVEWAEKLGKFLEIVWKFIKFLADILGKATELFGGLENVLFAIVAVLGSLSFVALFNALKLLVTLLVPAINKIGLLETALQFGKITGVIALFVLLALSINSLVRFLQGKDSLVGDIGKSIAKSMDESTGAVAAFFGLTKEEFQLWLVQTIGSIEDFLQEITNTLVAFFDEMQAIEWGEVWEIWKGIFSDGVEFIKEILGSAVQFISDIFSEMVLVVEGWITSLMDFILSIPGKVIDGFKSLPGIIGNIIKDIPGIGTIVKGVGSLFGDERGGGSAAQAGQTASPGLISNIENNRYLQNIVNRKGGASAQSNVTAHMNITQQPGEDSERFANRVVQILEESASEAVRNNQSGVRV